MESQQGTPVVRERLRSAARSTALRQARVIFVLEEACRIHMARARELGQLADGFTGRSETRILLWLSKQEAACAVDVMAYFGLSAGRVSNILKVLEKKGYIERNKVMPDHRRVVISVTGKGKQCAECLDENLHKVFEDFFQVIGDERAREFLVFEQWLLKMIRDGEIVLRPSQKI